jgi:putative heme-binding domain-containing protein
MKSVCRLGGPAFALAAWVLFATTALAQRELKEIPDPDPELERKTFQVAPGFEVNLFAADPLLAKPIQINFDAAGNLWAATSAVYPQIKPGQKANDKVLVIADTKGAGKADKITVFADGLFIPTGIAPGDGGVYVANSTELLHLIDTNGDGKADRSRVVLSGFGTEDTHHIVHAFQWGPEGFLYFNQSIYIHSHIETPFGVRRLGGGGVWQFRPDTMKLEVLARGWVNPWGFQIDRWGQGFVTDGAGGEGINYVMPGASYATAPGATKILMGLNPGSPKHCGLEIISGRQFPDDWQGDLITNDFRGHRVCRFKVSRDGSAYSSQEMTEVIRSTHPAFRPVDCKMGPDGALYIVDWYNPIIQHGEVDFRDPRRDQTHGRIWRVTAKKRPLVPRPQIVDATPAQLLEDLKAPETFTRNQAKRVMWEKHREEMLPLLDKWTDALDPSNAEFEHNRLEAAWSYQTLGRTRPDLLRAMLVSSDTRARAAAVRILAYWHPDMPDALKLLSTTVADADSQVRLESVRTLAALPNPEAVVVALRALDQPMDKFLDYALYTAVRDLEPHWFPAFREGKLQLGTQPTHLQFALGAIASSEAVAPVLEQLRAGKIAANQTATMWALVAAYGQGPELEAAFDRLSQQPPLATAEKLALLDGFEKAAAQRNVRPAGDLASIALLLDSSEEEIKVRALHLAGLWKLDGLRAQLKSAAELESNNQAIRVAAMKGLSSLGGATSIQELEALARGTKPASAREAAAVALASINPERAAACATAILSQAKAGENYGALVQALLQQKQGPRAFAAALAKTTLPADAAKLALRNVKASGRGTKELEAALTRAGKLDAKRPAPNPTELAKMVADVRAHGDAARGELVFRRKELTCFKCHAISGAGGQVGPDLLSVGASAPIDYIIESILLPNKAVKENYHSWIVSTTDGRFFTGIKARETNTELVLRDAEDKEISIPLNKIDDREVAPSLMPEGLADGLTQGEFLDLIRFLSELGKGNQPVQARARMVRRWQVLEPNAAAYRLITRNMFGAVTSPEPGLIWNSVYARVGGDVPVTELPRFKLNNGARQISFLRCEIEATTPGSILLKPDVVPANLWHDLAPIAAQGAIQLNLHAGKNIFTFAFDAAQWKDSLRLDIADVTGSPAKFQIVGGK